MTRLRFAFAATALVAALGAAGAQAQSRAQDATGAAAQDWPPTYTMYGTPGLIELPSAISAPDGQIGLTLGGYALDQFSTFTFQITPRLSGSFRYSRMDDFAGRDTITNFDRSFDMQFRLLDEGTWRPAVAVGLRDFIGTGLFTSEYVVATKNLTDRLRVTGGIGWGRLGTYNGFDNPLGALSDKFDTRPERDFGVGGEVEFGQFFRGDAALFGGVEYRMTDALTLTAEYSSDDYARERRRGTFDSATPVNLGLTYMPRPGYQLSAYALHGTEIGANVTFTIDPKSRPAPSGLESAPIPVAVRAQGTAAARTWDRAILPEATLRTALAQALATEGITLDAMDLRDRSIRLRYTNTRYRAQAQAMGRIARILTQALPPSIETFVLEPMARGIPLSATTLMRSDIEALENAPDAAWTSFTRAQFADAGSQDGLVDVPDPAPAFQWGIAPFTELALFDGDGPVRADFGIEASARYRIRPNLVLEGALRQRLYGDREDGAVAPSTLPTVRRTNAQFGATDRIGVDYLTLTHYGRPAADLYSRVSVGYLERMYGGISTELLWKPVDSRLALGAEVNFVSQRDVDLGFGFQDDPALTNILTGHVSGYYDFQNGFQAQVDVGRYLAGDYGATFALDRTFDNGWKVGAYFTLTDVPFDDFGEGSFDKGIRLSIPTDWILGQPTRDTTDVSLSSLTRDGGARLDLDGRLYDVVRDGHVPELADGWGRFWR